MKAEEFAALFFEVAKDNGKVFTKRGNIECPNCKNISIKKLEKIFRLCGEETVNASAKDLHSCGLASCCFDTFRFIADIVLNNKKGLK